MTEVSPTKKPILDPQSWLPKILCNVVSGNAYGHQIGRLIGLNMDVKDPELELTFNMAHRLSHRHSVSMKRRKYGNEFSMALFNPLTGTLNKKNNSTANSTARPDKGPSQYQTTGFIENHITSARYNLATFFPKQLFAQFSKLANIYFALIAGLQQVDGWSPTGQWTTLSPLVLFVGLAMAREAYDDWLRHKRDDTENNALVERLVCEGGSNAHWEFVQWKRINVGDIIRVKKDKPVPVDLLLLKTTLEQGLCYIQTSQLDGESNLKQRSAIEQINSKLGSLNEIANFKAVIAAEDPNEDIYNFDGSITLADKTKIPLTINNMILRGTTLRNTLNVIGVAVFTGENTKIRMNANCNKRTKSPTLERKTNQVVAIIFTFVLLASIICTCQSVTWEQVPRWFLFTNKEPASKYQSPAAVFFTFVILYNTMIPISLYVTLEIVKLFQAKFINYDVQMYYEPTDQPAEARTASLNEELGQVSYLFTDKTGTLTENKMQFRQMSVAGMEFIHIPDQHVDESEPGQDTNFTKELDSFQNITLTPPTYQDTSSKKNKNNPMGTLLVPEPSMNPIRSVWNLLMPRLNILEVNNARNENMVNVKQIGSKIKLSNIQISTSARSTRGLIKQLYETPHVPSTAQIHFFMQVVALCHQAIPDTDPISSTQVSSVTIVSGTGGKPVQNNQTYFTSTPDRRSSSQYNTSSSLANENKTNLDQCRELPSMVSNIDQTRLRSLIYQAASPDEVALVTAARDFGYTLVGRTVSSMTLVVPLLQMGDTQTIAQKYEILDTIEFSSSRKRMSIILRLPDGRIVLLAKGADNAILERSMPYAQLAKEEQVVYDATVSHIERFASTGLRTLVYAVRYLSESEYSKWSKVYLEAATSVNYRVKKLTNAANMIEHDWTIIGATGVEDKLQEGVPETIRLLERANIKVWMVTGDKKETAISIGHSSGLISDSSKIIEFESNGSDGLPLTDEAFMNQIQHLIETMNQGSTTSSSSSSTENPNPTDTFNTTSTSSSSRESSGKEKTGLTHGSVLVMDGPAIARVYELGGTSFKSFMDIACSMMSVLCCRVSPIQKSLVVQSVRQACPDVVTCAIGDGANDISMIQQAHVGIGITGREGMQAARSSDYSIARFAFLSRLLFVHGHWAYIRVSRFTLGTFYKCIMFYCTQLFFQIFCGYSGTSMYEQWTLTMYNVIFSSLPVILLGIFDRDLPCRILTEFPELYRIGQRNGEFGRRIFLLWLLKSLTQTVVIMITTTFFLPSWFVAQAQNRVSVDVHPRDSFISLYTMGTVAYTSVVLTETIQMCYISASTITFPLHLCAVITIGLWFLWQVAYSAVWPAFGSKTGYEQFGIWNYLQNSWQNIVSETSLWWAVVCLATTLGVAPEWVFYKVRRYYKPTDIEKLREMDVLQHLPTPPLNSHPVDVKKTVEEHRYSVPKVVLTQSNDSIRAEPTTNIKP